MAAYGAPAHPPSSTPYTILLLTVVAIFLVVPSFLAEQSSLLEMVSEINPVMVMVVPLGLVLLIRWLSSGGNRGAGFPVSRGRDPPAAGGSPVGVAIVLLIVLLMVWYQSSGEDESEE